MSEHTTHIPEIRPLQRSRSDRKLAGVSGGRAVEELVRLRERKGEPVAAAKARSLLDQLKTTAVA